MFNKFEDLIQQPTYKRKLKINSDGNDDYTSVLPEYYNKDCLCYGQKIKTKNGEKVFPAIKKAIYGNLDLSDINTNQVECFNTILRNRVFRLVRKKLMPAILEKQATKIWSWGNFLHARLTFVE